MKKQLLRLLCLCMTIVMVFGAAGCSSKNEESFDASVEDFDFDLDGSEDAAIEDSNGDDTTSAAKGELKNPDSLSLKELMAQVPKILKNSTITIWSWNPAKEVTGAEKVISDFEKKSGIKVKWVQIGYDEYESRIAAAVNSGNAPDLIRYQGPDIHRMYLCQDVKTATGYDFKGSVWDKRVSDVYTVKGKIYGVNLTNTLVNQPKVILYRKSNIEKYKLEDPYTLWKKGKWTWDKMISIAEDFQSKNTNGIPFEPYDHLDYVEFSGNSIIKFDGNKFVNNIKDKSLFNQLKVMCNLRDDDITASSARQEDYFDGEGRILFMAFNSIALRSTNAHLKDVKAEDDLYAVPIPKIANAKSYPMSELEAYGIPKRAKNGAATYFFLRYYLDSSNYNKNTYFCNKQALEVYNACMKNKSLYYSTDSALAQAAGSSGVDDITNYIRLQQGGAAQLKKQLDSLSPKFDLAVKKANEVLKKFK